MILRLESYNSFFVNIGPFLVCNLTKIESANEKAWHSFAAFSAR